MFYLPWFFFLYFRWSTLLTCYLSPMWNWSKKCLWLPRTPPDVFRQKDFLQNASRSWKTQLHTMLKPSFTRTSWLSTRSACLCLTLLKGVFSIKSSYCSYEIKVIFWGTYFCFLFAHEDGLYALLTGWKEKKEQCFFLDNILTKQQ